MNLEEYKEYLQAMAERKPETKIVLQKKQVKTSRLVKKQFVKTKKS